VFTILLLRQRLEYSFYVIALFTPLLFKSGAFFGTNNFSIAELVVWAILLMWAAKNIRGDVELKKTPMDKPLLLFLALTFAAAVGTRGDLTLSKAQFDSASSMYPLKVALDTLQAILLYFFITNTFESRHLKPTVNSLLIGLTVVSAVSVLQYAHSVSRDEWFYKVHNVKSTFEHHNVLGMYLVLSIPLAVYLTGYNRGARRYVLGAVTLISLLALLSSYSRSAWIGFLLATIFGVCVRTRKAVLLLMAAVVVSAVLLAGMESFAETGFVQRIFESEKDIVERNLCYDKTVDVIAKNPWGVGLGTFRQKGICGGFHHAHNIFLQIAVERGVLALAAFAYMLVIFFNNVLTRRHDDAYTETSLWGLTTGIIGVLVQGLFDYPFYSQRITLLFFFVLGVVMKIRAEHGIRTLRRDEPGKARIVFIALLLAVMTVWGYQRVMEEGKSYNDRVCESCNVILIVIDSLRADHVGAYGYARNTTPHIDEFAKESVLFENAYSQASWTRPSVASLFTSSYVSQHKIFKAEVEEGTNETNMLDYRFLTLAEALSREGYATFGVTANPYTNSVFGFDQGFDVYIDRNDGWNATAGGLNARFYNFINENNKAGWRFFAYIHYNDVHLPYTHNWRENDTCIIPYGNSTLNVPKPGVDNETGLYDYNKFNIFLAENAGVVDPRSISCMIDFYDGDIRYADEFIGRLIDQLKAYQLYDKTLIVVTADHGEEFLDHGRISHGHALYNELIHVPLIVRFPQGRHVKPIKENVMLIDVMPTILDYLDADAGVEYSPEGETLMPVILGEKQGVTDYVLSERLGKQVLIRDGMKLIKTGSKVSLYSLRDDPSELNDMSHENPELAAELEAELGEFNRRLDDSDFRPQVTEVPKKTLERLREIGYI